MMNEKDSLKSTRVLLTFFLLFLAILGTLGVLTQMSRKPIIEADCNMMIIKHIGEEYCFVTLTVEDVEVTFTTNAKMLRVYDID